MNLENLENDIIEHSKIFNTSNVYDIVQEQAKLKALHPHNEVMWDFINSEYYDENIYNEYKKLSQESNDFLVWRDKMLKKNHQELIMLDKNLKEKGVENLDKNDILPYIKILNKQLSIETINAPTKMYQRHGHKQLIAENIRLTFKNLELLEKCNEKENWDDIKEVKWGWHDVINISWGFYEYGIGKYSIMMVEPIYNTFNIFLKNNIKNDIPIFNELIFTAPPFFRRKTSVLWVIAMSNFQIGNIKKGVKTLKEMIDWSPYERLVYYRLNTRHLEAAIRIYDVEQSTESLKNVYSVLNDAINTKPNEPTETIMERGIVMYDFLKKIINK